MTTERLQDISIGPYIQCYVNIHLDQTLCIIKFYTLYCIYQFLFHSSDDLVTKHFTLSKYVSGKSRRSKRLKSAPHTRNAEDKNDNADVRDLKIEMSPSSRRKFQESQKAHTPKYNICYKL